MTKLPPIILQSGGRIEIGYSKHLSHASTDEVVIVSGNRQGFYSLANALVFLTNALVDRFVLNDMPFVSPSMVRLVVEIDDEVQAESGFVTWTADGEFSWTISSDNLVAAASEIHGLGYESDQFAIDHVHLDHGVSQRGVSILCEVRKNDIAVNP